MACDGAEAFCTYTRRDLWASTPMEIACEGKNLQMLKLLAKHADMSKQVKLSYLWMLMEEIPSEVKTEDPPRRTF